MSDGVWEDVVEMNKLCAKPTPREGERWRVTIEGTVGQFDPRPDSRSIVYELNGQRCVSWVPLAYGTWERLPDPDPEPEWAPGDLVLDADGRLLEFERDETCIYDRWRVVRTGGVVRDDRAPRPLRRLVPES